MSWDARIIFSLVREKALKDGENVCLLFYECKSLWCSLGLSRKVSGNSVSRRCEVQKEVKCGRV